jgi:Fe2+ transport system protein FeoA
MTLDQVPVGSAARLTDTSSHPSTRRLAELGLRPGADVAVMRRISGGGRLVGLGVARLALDKPTTTSLRVEVSR